MEGVGCGVWGVGGRFLDSTVWDSNLGFVVKGLGLWVYDLGFGV